MPPPKRPKGPWKSGPIPVIGLVGGIGAGKSRAAAMFAQHGAQVLDADAVGHALIDQNPAREEIVARFGTEVLDRSDPDAPWVIDRKKLSAIVFSDEAARKALEAILHPRMRRTFEKAISRAARNAKVQALVLDAAVLYEARWNELCDVVVFVEAPAETRLARVGAARGWTPEMLAAREAAQMPLDAKRAKVDFVLENAGDDAELAAAVGPLWEKLTRRPKIDPSKHRFRRPERAGGDPPPEPPSS
jgi:dephospho-CoA kinase